MSSVAPDGPYIYQPYGTFEGKGDHLYGIGGWHMHAIIKGLTKQEAQAVLAALLTLSERTEPTEITLRNQDSVRTDPPRTEPTENGATL